MRGPAITVDRPREHDPDANRPLVPNTPSATGGALPRCPVSVVMFATGAAHMASGEGAGVREGGRVSMRDGEAVRVRLGVRVGVGTERLAERQGSITPLEANVVGTAARPS